MTRLLKYAWAFPVTVVGLLLVAAAVLSGGSASVRGGVVEGHGGVIARLLRGNRLWRGGAAMAIGHVILARDARCLDRSRRHELGHVRQYERWGPLLLPAYLLVGCWLALLGYDAYLDHPFERAADDTGPAL